MTCVPRPSAELAHVAVPVPLPFRARVAEAQRVTVGFAELLPAGVKASVNVTVSARAELPDGLGVTVAVMVTEVLTAEGLADDVMATLVDALLTVWVREPAPTLKFASPP